MTVIRKKLTFFLITILFPAFLYFCNSNVVYRESKDIPEASWNKNNVLSFNFQINDTLQPYHVYLNIRSTSRYAFRNLFLFIETTSPEGYSVKDTFECILADERGKWYGKGWGDLYENKIPFKESVRFPRCGTYSIEVEQGMRKDDLKHITDLGIIIENANYPDGDKK